MLEVHQHSKRIEANLARASGDLNKLEEIFSEEIRDNPSDSYMLSVTLRHYIVRKISMN